ncbi:hypothetical protein ABZ615_08860 [Streptomyces sp. NPDC007325]|uniref:hypothetical protein n=1 Tax=Streptomyces sp. NPDC007325 TaxID=3154588 RepID=UPI0033F5003B
MDMQEAAERADAVLDASLRAVAPEVQWAHDTWLYTSCTVTRHRVVTTVISEERRGNFLGVIERHWKASGYEITSVIPSKEMPAVFARTSDGFGLTLSVGFKGQVVFKASTPCVDESDVAEPTTAPNGPAYPYGKIPTPYVRSDFWSATTPAATPAPGPSS